MKLRILDLLVIALILPSRILALIRYLILLEASISILVSLSTKLITLYNLKDLRRVKILLL